MFGYGICIYTCRVAYLNTMHGAGAQINVVISRACLYQLQLRRFLKEVIVNPDVLRNQYVCIGQFLFSLIRHNNSDSPCTWKTFKDSVFCCVREKADDDDLHRTHASSFVDCLLCTRFSLLYDTVNAV